MNTQEFTGNPERIPLHQIERSPDNPLGEVERDASFDRLVSSISEVGDVLVPIVVRRIAQRRYQLVDGERRFLAAKQLRKDDIPAHVISHQVGTGDLRKWMFHLHMTREQWEPLAQCRSLAEMYPQLERGVPLGQKPDWVKKLSTETWMSSRTASDRVHVLAWSKALKEKMYSFEARHPNSEIYSYVLAIEANVIEPSSRAFPDYYEQPPDRVANGVRSSLFAKTASGIENGVITSRDQVRSVGPLFQAGLDPSQSKAALKIFSTLVERDDMSYDDAVTQLQSRLPELLAERPPRPQKLIGLVKSLTETLKAYKIQYIDDSVSRETTRKEMKKNLSAALDDMIYAAKSLRGEL